MDSSVLLIQNIESPQPIELGRIMRGALVELGRDPAEQGIPIPNDSVSRSHSRIFSLGNYWVYEDLGSTNGSWINGTQVPPEGLHFLRSGDTLQLGSAMLQALELGADGAVVDARPSHLPQRSLLVLLGDHLVGEYPVPEYGRALVIGGAGADLQVEGMMLNSPSLTVERKGMFTTATSSSSEVAAFVNGVKLEQPVTLTDSTQITVARYRVLFNEPRTAEVVDTNASDTNDWSALSRRHSSAPQARDDYSGGFLNKPSQGALFGRPIEEAESDGGGDPESTVRLEPGAMPRTFRDYHPSMRGSAPSGGFAFDTLEERIVLFVGIALLLALLVLGGMWLFS